MDKEHFNKYLKERYDDQVNWYRKKSAHNQDWAKRVQIVILICSLATPVSAFLGQTVLTIFFSSLVSVLLAGSRYYKFDELWERYRTTRETLKKEKYMYEYSVGPYENAIDKEKLFVERVEHEISKENTEWINIREKSKQEK